MATQKQIALAKAMSVNITLPHPKPANQLMREVGYAPSTADRSSGIMRSKSFVALLEQCGVTDQKLVRCIKRGLSTKTEVSTMHRFLETSLKIKGHLKDNNPDGLGDLLDYIKNMKDFNIEILIAMKSKFSATPEPINADQAR